MLARMANPSRDKEEIQEDSQGNSWALEQSGLLLMVEVLNKIKV